MSIYKTYIILTNDFIFARGLELEIKSRYKDARVIKGLYENDTELVDIQSNDADFPKYTLALCDIDTISAKTQNEVTSLNLPNITFSREQNNGTTLLRPFSMSDLFSLIEGEQLNETSEKVLFDKSDKETLSRYGKGENTTALFLQNGHLHILGTRIKLSKKENALMALLLERKGSIVSYKEAAEIFDGHPDSNTVNVYIRYLRKKIAEVTSLNIIENIREVGYIIR